MAVATVSWFGLRGVKSGELCHISLWLEAMAIRLEAIVSR